MRFKKILKIYTFPHRYKCFKNWTGYDRIIKGILYSLIFMLLFVYTFPHGNKNSSTTAVLSDQTELAMLPCNLSETVFEVGLYCTEL